MKASYLPVGILSAALLGSSLGCYAYVAVPPDGLSPGEHLRATLRAEEREELRDLGIDAAVVEGELISLDVDAMLVYVPTTARQVGPFSQALKQRVRLPVSSVLELKRRELDRGRTTAVTAALGLGISVLAWHALSGESGANTASPPVDGTSQAIGSPRMAIGIVVSRH